MTAVEITASETNAGNVSIRSVLTEKPNMSTLPKINSRNKDMIHFYSNDLLFHRDYDYL